MNTDATTQSGTEDQGNAEGQTTTTTTEEGQGTQGQGDGANQNRRPIQPRINELTREREDARREAAYWRTQAESARKTAEPPVEPPKKPVAADFDTYEEFVEALADHKADAKISERLDKRDQQQTAKQLEQTRATNWSKSVETARKLMPDYDDVMNGAGASVPVAKHVSETILDSERGAELAAHLAKNPDVADRLNKLSPTQAARELGRIEAKLPDIEAPVEGEGAAADGKEGQEGKSTEAKPPAQAKPAARQTTAPAPAKTTGQNRSTETPLDKMSMDEYVAKRKAQGARWAR